MSAPDVNAVLLYDLKESTFLLFRACQGSFDFFCPFFPAWIFLKVAHRPVVTAAVWKEQKGHGCDTPLKLCVGAPPARISTLLASFHTIRTQRRPHRHGNVKTSSPHVWKSAGTMDLKRCAETDGGRRRQFKMETLEEVFLHAV